MSVVAARLDFGGPEAAVDLGAGAGLAAGCAWRGVVLVVLLLPGVSFWWVVRVVHSRVEGAFDVRLRLP